MSARSLRYVVRAFPTAKGPALSVEKNRGGKPSAADLATARLAKLLVATLPAETKRRVTVEFSGERRQSLAEITTAEAAAEIARKVVAIARNGHSPGASTGAQLRYLDGAGAQQVVRLRTFKDVTTALTAIERAWARAEVSAS